MSTTDTRTVVGVFATTREAEEAIRELRDEGAPAAAISLVARRNTSGGEELAGEERGEVSEKASNIVADAGIGAAVGGVGGLLLSVAGLVLPGIGPIIAAGPIAATLTGAGIGAAGGGLLGAIEETGVPEKDAQDYAEGVRRGDVLVTVKAPPDKAALVRDIMDRHGALDIDERAGPPRLSTGDVKVGGSRTEALGPTSPDAHLSRLAESEPVSRDMQVDPEHNPHAGRVPVSDFQHLSREGREEGRRSRIYDRMATD